jgi:UDP-N-acetylglucosamine 1-carboxyvinyltransferase
LDRLIVEGRRPLAGTVRNAGSKNAVLPILAASLLTAEPVRIENAPSLVDVESMLAVLRELGSVAERNADGSIEVRSSARPQHVAGWEHVRRMRGSVAVLGPLLARTGRAEVSQPGGCVIGVRPIDMHLKGLAALGARVRIEHGFVIAESPPGGLRGAEIYLGSAFGSTVLGTANVMMAATLARGRTILQGAACEPEVADLAHCLVAMGARIEGIGSPRLCVDGVEELGGARWRVIPDRIEAGTYLIAGAMTGGAVRVEGTMNDHHSALFDRLREAGIGFECGEDWVETRPYDVWDPAQRPRPTDVTTHPYPGFPTDLQAQWMALMTMAEGFSIITERIYSDRYMHLAELLRMGAKIRRQGATAIVQGTPSLSGAQVTASDLRASAALVLAGLVAHGRTEVHRVYHIDRGYERIEQRLGALGAEIRRTA